MSNQATMNIIGCGRLGKTLAYLWRTNHVVRVQGVMNRSVSSGQAAIDFIGAGTACAPGELLPADFTMITTGDSAIEDCASQLAGCGILRPGDIVFHCSGALGSDILTVVQACGALVASVHPIKSFAEPASAAASFGGTFCGIEGDPAATVRLTPLFESIGGMPLPLRSDTKPLYHAGMAISANFLVTLLQWGLDTLEQAGLPPAAGIKMLEPMVRNTVDNIFALGPAKALTGPIARRDEATVSRHIEALRAWHPELAKLYRDLGRKTLELAQSHSSALPAQEQSMERLLENKGDQ
jgi:predicted short-subunit dehydrogenase-like oxidoreductase (DUF2520 family)